MKSPWIILFLYSPNTNLEMLLFSHNRGLNKQIIYQRTLTVLSTTFAAMKEVFLILFRKTCEVSHEFRRINLI